jgi:hypothetical protein
MKTSIARFCVLPDEQKVLLGIDVGSIFDAGFVYEAVKMPHGEIVLRKVGKYALKEKGAFPCELSTYGDIMVSGLHLVTEEELQILKGNGSLKQGHGLR